MPRSLAIAHDRSLRERILPLRPLSVIAGANGSAKPNLWRALRLLAETSLHPELLPAPGRLIVDTSQRTQVWVITHSQRSIAALERVGQVSALMLEKQLGETRLAGQDFIERPAWRWPER